MCIIITWGTFTVWPRLIDFEWDLTFFKCLNSCVDDSLLLITAQNCHAENVDRQINVTKPIDQLNPVLKCCKPIKESRCFILLKQRLYHDVLWSPDKIFTLKCNVPWNSVINPLDIHLTEVCAVLNFRRTMFIRLTDEPSSVLSRPLIVLR